VELVLMPSSCDEAAAVAFHSNAGEALVATTIAVTIRSYRR
jgi:hypothetical protein